MKKIIIISVLTAIVLIGGYFSYQIFMPVLSLTQDRPIAESLPEVAPVKNFSDQTSTKPSSGVASKNCSLELGYVWDGDTRISKKQLCINAKVQAGDYMACFENQDPSECLAGQSIKRKEFLCYIDSDKIGRACTDLLFGIYGLGEVDSEANMHAKLSGYKGIDKFGGQQSVVLHDGENIPHFDDVEYRGGNIQHYITCGGTITPSCTPHWENTSCGNYSNLQGSNPIGWYYTEYKAIDACEKTSDGMKVTYTYFKLR